MLEEKDVVDSAFDASDAGELIVELDAGGVCGACGACGRGTPCRDDNDTLRRVIESEHLEAGLHHIIRKEIRSAHGVAHTRLG